MYKSVLLGADGSDNSYRAAKEVLNIIDEHTNVTILNVISIEEAKDTVLHGGNTIKERTEKLAKIIDLYKINNVKYNVVFERGIPEETMVKVSNSGDYDVIVLGNRGLNTLQEMMMGSVSRKVVKRSNIPVLIVK